MTGSRTRRAGALAVALALTAVACGGDGDDRQAGGPGSTAASDTTAKPSGIAAQVASYDLSTGRDQRVLVGVLAKSGGALVSFGTVDLAFAYAGTQDQPLDPPRPGPQAQATFVPIAGQQVTAGPAVPRFVEPSEGIGVYRAEGIRFDDAGRWLVTVTAIVEGRTEQATVTFPVGARAEVPVAGDPAPRSENLLPGAPDAPVKAVDSRAQPDGAVPDPELHTQTVAAAIGSGRPTMVVISTPVYCESRFCGPVTDSVQQLAQRLGDRMAFVHIEVWRDFEKQAINKAAAEWIFRAGAQDINEPWVFVVGRDGKVSERFDNIAADAELAAAAERVLR